MPEAVVENEWFKIYWDFNIQCDKVTEHRRHDIIVVEQKQNKRVVWDTASPGDQRVHEKEHENIIRTQRQKFLGFERSSRQK